jgi:uncharacterized membrane protein YhfC
MQKKKKIHLIIAKLLFAVATIKPAAYQFFTVKHVAKNVA